MDPQLFEHMHLARFGNYLLYFAISLSLFAAFFKAYVAFTPHDEIALIKGGNAAAAYILSGTLAGYAVNLGFAMFYAYNPTQYAIYGAFSAFVQILTYIVAHKALKGISDEAYLRGNAAAGILFGAIAFCVGVLNGASAY